MAMMLAAPLAAQSDPVAAARQLARSGQWSQALRILDRRLAAAPNDADARVLYGTILSWRREFGLARQTLSAVHLEQPFNTDAIVALANVELWSDHPSDAERLAREGLDMGRDNVDLMVIRAAALRRLNRRPLAERQIEQAYALSPQRDDVRLLRRVLRHEVYGSEVVASENYERWSANAVHESELMFRQNMPVGTAVARLSDAHRAGQRGTMFELEAYPRLGTSYAYLEAGTASGELYGHSRYATEFFRVFPRGEISLGARRLNFANPVNVVTASASTYYRDYLFTLRGDHAARGASGNAGTLLARRYFVDGVQFIGLRIGVGSIRENIRTAADIRPTSTRDIALEGALVLRGRWMVIARAGNRDSRLGVGYQF